MRRGRYNTHKHAGVKVERLVMAENPGTGIRLVRIEDLRHCLIAAFARLELPREDAEQVTEVLLDSEMRGHENHGVHLLGFLADAYRGGGMNPRPRIRALRETEGALLLDGDHSHVVGAARAMRWCIERARERNGMAVAGVRDSQPIVLGFYARMAAEAGLIGFACANGIPMVAPPGGRTPTLGTNPLAYAIPAGCHPPVVLDVATTTGAAFKVRLAAQRNRPVPEGMILDREGRPTTDPNEFVWGGLMAPLGSPAAPHKGFGLALVIDALTGVLTGADFARDFPTEPATVGNATVWALDIEAFMARQEFLARMEALIDQVKAGERLAGVDELLVPGERGHRRYHELSARGTVPLSGATWEGLTKACSSLSISPPSVRLSRSG
jgi:LDH2 family malate/lactate/ureidoglycolate dehydrogenase